MCNKRAFGRNDTEHLCCFHFKRWLGTPRPCWKKFPNNPISFWGPKETKKMLGELIPVMLQPGLSEWWGRGGSSVIPDVLPVCTQDFYLVLVHFYPKILPDILPFCPPRFLPGPFPFLPKNFTWYFTILLCKIFTWSLFIFTPAQIVSREKFPLWVMGRIWGDSEPYHLPMSIIKHINWLVSLHSYMAPLHIFVCVCVFVCVIHICAFICICICTCIRVCVSIY